jgi:hypothetical protein
MKRAVQIAGLLLVCALTATAATSTGSWIGTFTLPGVQDPLNLFLILEENGTRVIGTGGSSRTDQHPILNGMLQNGTLTLEIDMSELGGKAVLVLVQSGEEMAGRMDFQIVGEVRTGSVSLKRTE